MFVAAAAMISLARLRAVGWRAVTSVVRGGEDEADAPAEDQSPP